MGSDIYLRVRHDLVSKQQQSSKSGPKKVFNKCFLDKCPHHSSQIVCTTPGFDSYEHQN